MKYQVQTTYRGSRRCCAELGHIWYNGDDINEAYRKAEFYNSISAKCKCQMEIIDRTIESYGK